MKTWASISSILMPVMLVASLLLNIDSIRKSSKMRASIVERARAESRLEAENGFREGFRVGLNSGAQIVVAYRNGSSIEETQGNTINSYFTNRSTFLEQLDKRWRVLK